MSEPERQIPDRTDPAFYILRRRRMLARQALLFERLWVALWPPVGLAGALLCGALLDLPSLLPPVLHVALLVVGGLAVLGLLLNGLRRVRAPDAAAADRRLETASGLRHRPLSVLTDRPALPGAEVLWKAHLARAAAVIGRLRVGRPHPGLAARDPRALRGALVVALIASVVIAGPEAPTRLARAIEPTMVPPAAAPATQLQAWITPPAYTGLAPLFLKPKGGAVSVPAGSHLTVSVTGGSGEPNLLLDGKAEKFQALDNASFQADQDLTVGGRLSIHRQGRELAAWDLTVVADRAPVVSFPEPPGQGPGGRVPQTRLPWQVSHDYGVVSLQAELHLRDRPDTPALIVTIPLPGGSPKSAKGVRLQDLTANPWAGLSVTARLVARDAPGLTGTSGEEGFNLPERRFQNPVAQALMAVRKMLTLKPDERLPAIQELDRLAGLDEVWKDDLGAFLNLRAIGSLLYHDRSAPAVDDAQSRMWQLALHLEEGAPERTARALEQAREALRQALDAEKRGEKIDPAEIDRRMQALEEALQKRLDALAEQARRDPGTEPFDPQSHPMDAREMQRLAEEMREAAKQGRMDDARDKMAELDQMLAELQDGRPEHGKMTDAERKRAQQRQRGQQQMTALQDIVRRQGGLLDHAQGRTAEPDPLNRTFPPRFSDQQGNSSPDDEAAKQDAAKQDAAKQQERNGERRVQEALRRALGELMQQYGDLTGQVPPNLGDADSGMHDAANSLGRGSDPAAAAAELRVIEALQKGGRSMSQQLSQQFGQSGDEQGDEEGDDGDQDGDMSGNGQDGMQQGGNQYGPGYGYSDRRGDRDWSGRRSTDRRSENRRDPLGREMKEGTSGTDESDDVRVPDKMEEARTRAIQDELRRRDAERTRPQPELEYIERLLKEF